MIDKQKQGGVPTYATWQRYLPVVLVLCVGIAASLFGFNQVRDWEHRHAKSLFAAIAGEHVQALQRVLDQRLDLVHTTAALLGNRLTVSPQDFSGFFRFALQGASGVQTLGWAPAVDAGQRSEFEASLQSRLTGYSITEQNDSDQLVAAQTRPTLYPLTLVTPQRGNEHMLGYDLGSEDRYRAALRQAVRSASITASGFSSRPRGGQASIDLLVCEPVYLDGAEQGVVGEGQSVLLGYAVGIFDVREMAVTAMQQLDHQGVMMEIQDAGTDTVVVFDRENGGVLPVSEQTPSFNISKSIDVAGRSWNLNFSSVDGFAASGEDWRALSVLLGGLGLTTLLGGYLGTAGGRSSQVRQLMQEHTRVLQNEVEVRQQVENSLRLEQAFAEDLIDTVQVIVLLLDKEGKILSFNRYMEELCGYSLHDVKGKDWFDIFIDAQERDRQRHWFQRDLKDGGLSMGVHNLKDSEGRLRLIEWHDQVQHDANNEVISFLRVGLDVTECNKAQSELRIFRAILESSSEAVALCDGNCTVLYLNPACERLFSRSLKDTQGEPYSVFFPGEVRDHIKSIVHTRLKKGQSWEGEVEGVDLSGRRIPLWKRMDSVMDDNGKMIYGFALMHDNSRQKQVNEQRLEDAKRQRDTLVREVHHRIKNNLQGVIGLLRKHMVLQPESRTALEEAVGQVASVAQVHGLQSGNENERVMLGSLLQAISHEAARLLHASAQPRVEMPPDTTELISEEAVPVALILNELLTNAIKYVDGEGNNDAIRVLLEKHDSTHVVQIRSVGRLSPAFNLARGHGLGTGLSLVKSLLPGDGALLDIRQEEEDVVAELRLWPPVTVASTA